MDLPLFNPVSLLLVWITVAAAHVEPPTNVTLHCHNLNNTVRWQYGQVTPGLQFRVDILKIIGPPEVIWVDPPALQADASFLSDPSNEYMLTVTAVIGQNKSEPAPSEDGLTFSYSQASQVNQNCFVDLPAVNVTAQPHDEVLFRFEHPWLFYRQKLSPSRKPKARRKKSHDADIDTLPGFIYDVVIINQKEQPHSFICEESVCEEKLPVDAAQKKHCLMISGELQQMLVKGTQEYCTLALDETYHTVIYIVVSVLAACIFAFISYMAFKKFTKPSTSLPRPLTFKKPMTQRTMGPVQDAVVVSEVAPASPTPLLPTTAEEDGGESPPADTSDYDFRLPLRGVSGDVEVGRPNGESDAYMQGSNLDEDEEPDEAPSGYERRAVPIQLAPDELAEGYRR